MEDNLSKQLVRGQHGSFAAAWPMLEVKFHMGSTSQEIRGNNSRLDEEINFEYPGPESGRERASCCCAIRGVLRSKQLGLIMKHHHFVS